MYVVMFLNMRGGSMCWENSDNQDKGDKYPQRDNKEVHIFLTGGDAVFSLPLCCNELSLLLLVITELNWG
jgi:hypothetical protein